MEIDYRLLEFGFNESLINFYHSRTRNKAFDIVQICIVTYANLPYKKKVVVNDKLVTNGGVVVDVKLSRGRKVQYELNLAKIRQKRINILMNK